MLTAPQPHFKQSEWWSGCKFIVINEHSSTCRELRNLKSYYNNLAPPPVVEEGGRHGLMVCTQEALVFKMALFINGTASFFAFVSAMRPLQVLLGPLDRYVMPHYTLRPELTMKQDLNNMDESSRLHLRVIAKYVTQVTVVDWTDLAWLHHHVHPSVDIHWVISQSFGLPPTTE
ncbi:hypothetical protein DYB34_006404 [Aphanomyces astaci]|uniref:Uncharacterized protein n=1 Tax=Aphanomyces astaci TaxID=112090 RepID=A0A418C522_APHAT|nr:hypothetical protein DYB34_006404 [Aphanomyces astaci]